MRGLLTPWQGGIGGSYFAFLCASQHPECSPQWLSESLVLSHRKKCLIPAHRETPNSQQEETQSQTKMFSVSPFFYAVIWGGKQGDIWLWDINWTECTLTVPFHIWGCVAGSLVSIKKRAMTYAFNDLTGHNCLSSWFVRQVLPSPISIGTQRGAPLVLVFLNQVGSAIWTFKINLTLCIVFFHLIRIIHGYCKTFF